MRLCVVLSVVQISEYSTEHTSCHAEATSKAINALGDAMMVAGAVGIPVFFVLLTTIGPSQPGISNVNSMVEQVASYQFVGVMLTHALCCVFGILLPLCMRVPMHTLTLGLTVHSSREV